MAISMIDAVKSLEDIRKNAPELFLYELANILANEIEEMYSDDQAIFGQDEVKIELENFHKHLVKITQKYLEC